MALQFFFNLSVLFYFLLSTGHLIFQFKNIPKEMNEVRLQIWAAMAVNLILLTLNLFVIFTK
jgi:hypothetical protein